jgi:hypothetical protein
MVKKISQERLEAMRGSGALVAPKPKSPVSSTPEIKPVEAPVAVPAPAGMDIEALAVMLRESQRELVAGIVAAIPQPSIEVRSRVKTIHIRDIKRNRLNRIDSAVMALDYEDA